MRQSRLSTFLSSVGLCVLLAGCTSEQQARVTVAIPSDAVACHLCGKAIPDGAGLSAQIAGEGDVRHYRCIHCALTELHDESRDITLNARSPVSDTPIQIRRHERVWTAEPVTTVYLILPERADECLDLHQPFVSHSEFDVYVKAHPDIAAQHPQAYTIAQFEQILVAGKPRP